MPKSTKRVMWGASGREGTPIYDKTDLSPDWQPMSMEELEIRKFKHVKRLAQKDDSFKPLYQEWKEYMATKGIKACQIH